MNGVRQSPGQHVQSVAEASFDAWVKYYRADENTPNATVSYYTKGSLVALRLDLALRAGGKATLDDVMRALWRDAPGGAVTEELILKTVARLGGKAVAAELRDWVHQRGELDVLPALARVGVEPELETLNLATELGIRVSEGPVTRRPGEGRARGRRGRRGGPVGRRRDPGRRRLARAPARRRARRGSAPARRFELLVVRQQRVRTLRVADRIERAAQRRRVAQPEAERVAQRGDAAPVATAGWASSVRSPWRESRRRRAAWFALILAVLLAHALFGLRVAVQRHRLEHVATRPKPHRGHVHEARAADGAAARRPRPRPRPRRARTRASRAARASSAPLPASAPERVRSRAPQLDAQAQALGRPTSSAEQRARDAGAGRLGRRSARAARAPRRRRRRPPSRPAPPSRAPRRSPGPRARRSNGRRPRG